jgi:xanthine dehydrogenase YagS FAD-binding subunit
MNAFDYFRPKTIAEAVKYASETGAAYLAGGTNLMDLMKGGIASPSRLVDINHVPGLDRIERLPGGGVRIGALVRNADLAYDPDFAKRFPAVAEALLSGASAQLRNAATVGGNLLQRTRCAYFYDAASACNKREPGAGCEARGGETRLHAVLGWSEQCIATNPSDFCVPLAALDAIVEIAGKAGLREVPLEGFHRLPGDSPERDSVLEPGELVVAVRLPAEAPAFSAHSRYLKVRERTSYAFAVASAAAALRIEGGAIVEARIALGGVAPKPWRARAAEEILVGARPEAAAFRRAAARGREAVGRQCLQNRTGAKNRDASPDAGGRRHPRANARPPRLGLRPSSRNPPPCLRSFFRRRRLISATVRISASRTLVARAS